jgi:DnaK suppressor protein
MSEASVAGYQLQLATLRDRLASVHRDRDEVAIERVPGSMNQLALACERNLALHRVEWTSFLTGQVSEALARIEDGSYGLCLQCGQPIAAKRLARLASFVEREPSTPWPARGFTTWW